MKNSSNEKARELLEEIFKIWTKISVEDEVEYRSPANENEYKKSFEILKKIDETKITEEEVKQRYDVLKNVLKNYKKENASVYCDADNNAYEVLSEIFELWTDGEDRDGSFFRWPANRDEIDKSNELLKKINKKKLKNSDIINRYNSIVDVISEHEKKNPKITKHDSLAWDKLDKVSDIWDDIYEDDENGDVKLSVKEKIKLSAKLLKEVKAIPFTDSKVKDKNKRMRKLVAEIRRQQPNYVKPVINSLFISFIAIIILMLVLQFSKFRQPGFEYTKNQWITSKATHLKWDGFQYKNTKLKKKYSAFLPKGTIVKPIAKIGRDFIQVETQKGERGFIFYRDISGAKQAIAKKNIPLFSNIKDRKSKSYVKKDEKVKILSYHRKAKELMPNIAKVRTAKGKIGYLNNYSLKFPFIKKIPELSQTYIFPTTIDNIKTKIVGKNISNIESSYGAYTSLINKGNKKIVYFRHINVVKDNQVYKGLFLNLNKDNVVESYELNNKRKLKSFENWALVSKIRTYEPSRILSFDFYKTKTKKLQWWDDFKAWHWTTRSIGWIIQFIIKIVLIFLFFSIPRLIASPIMILIGYFRLLGNFMVKLLNLIVLGLFSYIFFVFMMLMMNQWLTPAILAVPTFIFWWWKYKNNINYNRCPQCHTMNIALNRGTTFNGKSKSVSWGTYDVYKGRTETSDKIIDNYETRDQKTTTITKHYVDHRVCARCGHKWGVNREVSESHTKNY